MSSAAAVVGAATASASTSASAVDVPTLPHEVRAALRRLGHPVRLFGENLANVRDRLQRVLLEGRGGAQEAVSSSLSQQRQVGAPPPKAAATETQYTRASGALMEARQRICKYSLHRARDRLQLERRLLSAEERRRKRKKDAAAKLATVVESIKIGNQKKQKRQQEKEDDATLLLDRYDFRCRSVCRAIQRQRLALEASQYADRRSISSLAVGYVNVVPGDENDDAMEAENDAMDADDDDNATNNGSSNRSLQLPVAVAASWAGNFHVWSISASAMSSPSGGARATTMPLLTRLGTTASTSSSSVNQRGEGGVGDASAAAAATTAAAHDDRIMGIAMNCRSNTTTTKSPPSLVATTSLDGTAKLWNLRARRTGSAETTGDVDGKNNNNSSYLVVDIEPVHCFVGHARRTCRAAFHPTSEYVGTTSYDHTWRLWSVETGQNLLLQDGHADATYGIDFHPDGGLVATTDLAGVVHVWDLRTGKSICHYDRVHAGRVLNAKFRRSPAGCHQLATAGDDGTIQICDLRKRNRNASAVSIPAHNNLVTDLEFDLEGEILSSSSFDGTVKVWSCRTWKCLTTLEGHQGKVTGVGVLCPSIGDTSIDFNNKAIGSSSSNAFHPSIVTCGFDKTVKLWK